MHFSLPSGPTSLLSIRNGFTASVGQRRTASGGRHGWPAPAINNQHSHIEEELVLMQKQLSNADTDEAAQGRRAQGHGLSHGHGHRHERHAQHVFHDHTKPSRKRRVDHEHGENHYDEAGEEVDLQRAVEDSHQYSKTNFVSFLDDPSVEAPDKKQAPSPATPARPNAGDGTAIAALAGLLYHAAAAATAAMQRAGPPPLPPTPAPPAPPSPTPTPSSSPRPHPRPIIYHAAVADFPHPSALSRTVVSVLARGDKLVLELPDQPDAVSSLLTGLGHAAVHLQRAYGLATALDPVQDVGHAHSAHHHNHHSHHSGSHNHHSQHTSNHHSGVSHVSAHHQAPPTASQSLDSYNVFGGSGGGSPSSSYDGPSAAHSHSRIATFTLRARAVPMPNCPTEPASSATPASPPAPPPPQPASPNPSPAAAAGGPVYAVGCAQGQEVLHAGPAADAHALLPPLLRAVLRDGLVTLRCTWYDEEIEQEPWSDDEGDERQAHERAPAGSDDEEGWGGQTAAQAAGAGAAGWGPPASPLLAAAAPKPTTSNPITPAAAAPPPPAASPAAPSPTRPFSPTSSFDGAPPASPLLTPPFGAAGSPAAQRSPAASLVRVPGVLRALFKLDRTLRSLDPEGGGGLVLLPHTFTRAGDGSNRPVLFLDVVIA